MARSNRNLSRIPVFLKAQNPAQGSTPHKVSKRIAALLIQHALVKRVAQGLQLVVPGSWAIVKLMITPRHGVVCALNPPTYHTMNFQNYPEPDRVTVWQNHRAFLR